MAIISVPVHATTGSVVCVICRERISLANATAGVYDARGQQMFACTVHIWNRSEYIVGWADFVIAERRAGALPVLRDDEQRGEDDKQLLY